MFNGTVYKCASAQEPVKSHSIESYCSPILTYCIGELDFKLSDVIQYLKYVGMMYFEKFEDIVDMTQLNSCNIFVMNFLLINIWLVGTFEIL